MKRFWTDAAYESRDGVFHVTLDGKPVRLPSGTRLVIQAEALARAIADEWQQAGSSVGGDMTYADVPLTGLAGTVQERIAPDPRPTVAAVAAYGGHDLLCYRATQPSLAARQERLWQPWLDWAATSFGARLRVTTGVMPVSQRPQSVAALEQVVAAQTPDVLGALGIAVPATGSLILGLAVVGGHLVAAGAHELACLDESFQVEAWGDDPAAAAKRALMASDVALAERFVMLTRETLH